MLKYLVVLGAIAAADAQFWGGYYYAVTEASRAEAECVQVPKKLIEETLYCHGPYPKPTCKDEDKCMKEWKEGSCADNGFPLIHERSMNATGQTDPEKCDWKGWFGFLATELSRTSWVNGSFPSVVVKSD